MAPLEGQWLVVIRRVSRRWVRCSFGRVGSGSGLDEDVAGLIGPEEEARAGLVALKEVSGEAPGST